MATAVDKSKIDKILSITQKAIADDPSVTIFPAGDLRIASKVTYTIPSGIPELDLYLGGRGGLPAGKVIEYFGFEMCGKTTASLHAIAEVQKLGGIALFVDSEHSWDERRAEDCGVDLSRVQVASAFSIEAIFNTIEQYVEAVNSVKFEGPVLVVVDSVTGVTTEFEQEKAITSEARVGQDARQIRRGVRRLNGMLAKTKITCILINHAIAKVAMFGRQSQAAGGHGIKFVAAVRVEFVGVGNVKGEEGKRTGQKVILNLEKLKNAPIDTVTVKDLELNKNGFDQVGSLLRAGIETGWITRVNQKVYSVNIADETKQFVRDEFSQVLNLLGGYDGGYKAWIEQAKNSGYIRFWHE